MPWNGAVPVGLKSETHAAYGGDVIRNTATRKMMSPGRAHQLTYEVEEKGAGYRILHILGC